MATGSVTIPHGKKAIFSVSALPCLALAKCANRFALLHLFRAIMDLKKLFGFGSSTPPPPPPPLRPPPPPGARPGPRPAPATAPTIIGQWQEPNGNDTTEFRADGTLMEKQAGGETISGRYSLDGARLKVRLEGVAEELAFNVVIKGDMLEMTDSEGNTTKYRRASP